MALLTIVRRTVSGYYVHVSRAAERVVRRVEDEFGFESGVERVLAVPMRSGMYWYRANRFVGGTVLVPAFGARSVRLREFVFHEMGHAICETHDIGSQLRRFTRRTQETDGDYERATAEAAERRRPRGFVSGYATCSREEDFCETLAAYLCNRKTWRSKVAFDGDRVDVRRDPRVRRKLEAVHEVLGEIGRTSGGQTSR